MGKKLFILTCLIGTLASVDYALARSMYSGKIVSIENSDSFWYENPTNDQSVNLGTSTDFWNNIKKQAIGISNANLAKIPLSDVQSPGVDADNDGLSDELETAMGLNKTKNDSDGDGYPDRTEIINQYNPLGTGRLVLDSVLASRLSGRFFLQAQGRGEIWYITSGRRLLLTKDMKIDWLKDNFCSMITEEEWQNKDITILTPEKVLSSAADAIRKKSPTTSSYFTPDLKKAIDFSLSDLSADSRLAWANLLSGAKLEKSTDAEKIYSTEVYFQGKKNNLKFYISKQGNNNWLISRL